MVAHRRKVLGKRIPFQVEGAHEVDHPGRARGVELEPEGEKVLSRIEITTNTDGWEEVVKHFADQNEPVGVGSVKNLKLAREAKELGAMFLVSPNYPKEAIDFAIGNEVPIMPTTFNFGEIKQAERDGLPDVKIFPAVADEVKAYLRAINQPFRDEIKKLEEIGFRIIPKDSLEPGEQDKYRSVYSPDQFYQEYLGLKDLKPGDPYKGILIGYPNDGHSSGIDRLKELSVLAERTGIRTYATGIPSEVNFTDIFKAGAYGAGISGMFNIDAIYDGDFEKVEFQIRTWMHSAIAARKACLVNEVVV